MIRPSPAFKALIVFVLGVGVVLVGFGLLWVQTGMLLEGSRQCKPGSVKIADALAQELNSDVNPFGTMEVWDVCYRGQAAYLRGRSFSDEEALVRWASEDWSCIPQPDGDRDAGLGSRCKLGNVDFELRIGPPDTYASGLEIVIHQIALVGDGK